MDLVSSTVDRPSVDKAPGRPCTPPPKKKKMEFVHFVAALPVIMKKWKMVGWRWNPKKRVLRYTFVPDSRWRSETDFKLGDTVTIVVLRIPLSYNSYHLLELFEQNGLTAGQSM